ncbi:MAG: hypothetical protein HC875_17380 [Anaerolineales bacterium]|nr:hypothetical protein [Anaerolineales bacterium]
MLVYTTKNGQVEWLEAEKIVVKTFSGFIYGEEMKTAFNEGLEALKKNNGCKWLSDNRGLKPYRQEDVKWINDTWFPQALKAGWKYWAVLEPETILGQVSMRNFLDFYQQLGITLRVFHSMEDGLAWLNSVQ